MALENTCYHAQQRGLIVIGDGKRNDIGRTAGLYAGHIGKVVLLDGSDGGSGYSPHTRNTFDALTINPYLGIDGVKPFIDACTKEEKGIFVLVKTSNKSSAEFQDKAMADGRHMYQHVGELVSEWGKQSLGRQGYSSVGAVVGATHPREAEDLRKLMPHTLFLLPGYGTQGAGADDVVPAFDENGHGGLVVSARKVMFAYLEPKYKGGSVADAARAAAMEMKVDITYALHQARKIPASWK